MNSPIQSLLTRFSDLLLNFSTVFEPFELYEMRFFNWDLYVGLNGCMYRSHCYKLTYI